MTRNIAIIGFAKTSRDQAPYDDPAWEIWGVNDTWAIAPRMDRIIEMHAPWIYGCEIRRRPGHTEFLRQFRGPVYMLDRRDDIPTSLAYPLQEVADKLGRAYFTSSVAYAIGLAIILKPDTIGLWGVELATASEYERQRPCVEYLLGLAEGRGIQIVLPAGCQILSAPLYGMGSRNQGGEHLTPAQFTQRMASLAKREAELVADLERHREQAQRLNGALDEARHYLSKAATAEMSLTCRSRVASLEGHQEPLAAQMDETSEALAHIRGMLNEARFWACQTPEGADPSMVLLPRLTVVPPADGGLVIEEEVG